MTEANERTGDAAGGREAQRADVGEQRADESQAREDEGQVREDEGELRAEEESAKAMEAEVPHPPGYPDPGQEQPS